MEKTMFKFEDQYKQYEQLLERTKQAYEFWLNAVTSTFEDLYKLKKKWFNGGYNPPFVSQSLQNVQLTTHLNVQMSYFCMIFY